MLLFASQSCTQSTVSAQMDFFRKNQAVAFDLFRLVTVCSSGKMYVFFFHKLEWKSD